ncbi:MAG: sporulation protein YqfD [Oscillospiraceae bacterium]|jgi:similar to stage IV sporulation protein|nr:sporulation protein YqfD [Oscillospiraceae bacterium]
MQRALNLLRGIAHVEILCRYPERLLNLCASNDIELWNIERVGVVQQGVDVELRADMRVSGFRRLRGLSLGHGFELRRVARRGAPSAIKKLRRRYVLIAGLAMCALLTRALSLFVWDIRVLGNESVPDSRILEALKTLGFSYGSFGPGVRSEELANELILEIPELSWFAVNIRGSRADVLVRERIPKPEIVSRDTPSVVVAARSGVITKISVLEGTALVKPGDTVEKGGILVTGRDSGNSSGPALAEIQARTWYEFSACMPVKTTVKRFTGEKKRRRSLIIAGKKINLYFNSGILWSECDKIIDRRSLTLPGGASLPVALVTESYLRYEPVVTKQSRERAESILRAGLEARLRSELDARLSAELVGGGDISAVAWESREDGGVMTVTLRAECSEQIAVTRALTKPAGAAE